MQLIVAARHFPAFFFFFPDPDSDVVFCLFATKPLHLGKGSRGRKRISSDQLVFGVFLHHPKAPSISSVSVERTSKAYHSCFNDDSINEMWFPPRLLSTSGCGVWAEYSQVAIAHARCHQLCWCECLCWNRYFQISGFVCQTSSGDIPFLISITVDGKNPAPVEIDKTLGKKWMKLGYIIYLPHQLVASQG